MIRAECHSDDFVFESKFDATPYFEQATADDVIALVKCEWGGDYPADEVAKYFEGVEGYGDVSRIFEYCVLKDGIGFECHVEDTDAMNWLRDNRFGVFDAVCVATDLNAANYPGATTNLQP